MDNPRIFYASRFAGCIFLKADIRLSYGNECIPQVTSYACLKWFGTSMMANEI